MDPNLADVDKVIKRYEDEDAAVELQTKALSLNGDPRGGVDLIAAASYGHNDDDGNKLIKKMFDSRYSTVARGPDGVPTEDRIVNKW